VGAVEERPGLAGLRYQGVIGPSQRMADVLATVCAVARGSEPVLIRGENGTGKDLIARALHDSSARAGRPFVSVNCAGVPEDLLEVELLGTEEGGAPGGKLYKGEFEAADGGTLFLDEVGDVGPALQSKLLRVLEEGTFERVGGRVAVNVDVRVVAATSRLKTVELLLPSLNERTEDIPDLVRYLVRRTSHEFGHSVTEVSAEALSRLTSHRWLGNVRELEHVVERMVLLARGDTIQVDDLPPNL
jgi:DNA-binding NtrC family response regulator